MADKVLDLFEQMSVSPNNIIYIVAFKACAQLVTERAMNLGNGLVQKIGDELAIDTILSNSAMHMLMKFGDIAGAEHAFRLIKNKSVVSYGVMMQGTK